MKEKLLLLFALLLLLYSCSEQRERKRRERAEPFIKAGWEAIERGELEAAKANFFQATQICPNCVIAHIDYQDIASLGGVTDTLLDHYKRLLDKNKNKAVFYFLYGRLLASPADQMREYRRALELDPDNAWAFYGLGYLAFDKQHFDEAIDYFQKAVELEPDNARFHSNLGATYFYRGLYDKAETELKKAIELEPDYPPPYYNLAGAYYHKGNYDSAIETLEKYIAINPRAKNIEEAKLKLKQLRGK